MKNQAHTSLMLGWMLCGLLACASDDTASGSGAGLSGNAGAAANGGSAGSAGSGGSAAGSSAVGGGSGSSGASGSSAGQSGTSGQAGTTNGAAGTSGVGGGNGTGGTSATGGAAGTSGTAGTSGAAGASAGGTGGAAGTVSTGGTGGTAGTAGGTGGTSNVVEEVKVAFIGDTGNGSAFANVLDLVMAEQVDAVVHNGDFDYGLDPDAFFATVDGKVGGGFPYFASVGNHDAPSWNDYSAYLKAHLDAVGVTLDEPDMLDQKFAFHWRGLHSVFVGENGHNAEFAQFIDQQFSTPSTDWKICGWHKNQQAMQIGGKTDEMGWDVYENCRKHGAIITTGHEHSYERTKTLTDMSSQQVDASCSSVENECVSPGRTFVVVSGLGGVGIRDQKRCLPKTPPYGCNGEWATIYTSDQNANFGALFIVFNVGGDPSKAHGYFKNIDGAIVDQFDVTRSL